MEKSSSQIIESRLIISSFFVPILADVLWPDFNIARLFRILFVALIFILGIVPKFWNAKLELTNVRVIVAVSILILIGIYSSSEFGGYVPPYIIYLLELSILISISEYEVEYYLEIVTKTAVLVMYGSLLAILLKLRFDTLYFDGTGYWLPVNNLFQIPGRAFGMMNHPNQLGQICALGIVGNIALRRGSKILFPIGFLLLFMCGSRTSILATIVGIIYFRLRGGETPSNTKSIILGQRQILRQIAFYFPKLVVTLIGISFLWSTIIFNIGNLDESALTGRIEIWQTSLAMLKGNFLTGLGWGWEQVSILNGSIRTYAVSAHNSFLEIFISTGIAGALIFAYLLTILVVSWGSFGSQLRSMLVTVAILGVSESNIDFVRPNIQTFLFLVALLSSQLFQKVVKK